MISRREEEEASRDERLAYERERAIKEERAVQALARLEYATGAYRSDGGRYPEWSHEKRLEIHAAAFQLLSAATPEQEEFQLRVLYDLYHFNA